MRRRNRRGPNDSESTGKIGQEVPVDQPAPLQPAYPEPQRDRQRSHGENAKESKEPKEIREKTGAGSPAQASARVSHAESAQNSISGSASDSTPGATFDAQPEVHAASSPAALASDESKAAEGKLVLETQPESPSTPPPEAQPASSKHPKGYVVLTIGLPGSGKTTWFKRRGVMPLSSDMLRSILFDDITEQRYQGLVFSTLRSLLRARLIAKMPWNYVDATNLSPHERRQWIKMAQSFGYDVHAVFFDVPFEVCMERNRKRERVVSEEAMRKMAERLKPPSFKEGFSKITMVRVKSAPASKADESPVPE